MLVSSGKFNSLGMLYVSSGWGSKFVSKSHRSCATSQAVLEAVQNSSGDSHHPIWRQVGTMILMGLVSLRLGRTYAKCHASSSNMTSLQNPSLMSHLANTMGPLWWFVDLIIATNLQSAWPICSMALWSDIGTVVSLTLGIFIPCSCNL